MHGFMTIGNVDRSYIYVIVNWQLKQNNVETIATRIVRMLNFCWYSSSAEMVDVLECWKLFQFMDEVGRGSFESISTARLMLKCVWAKFVRKSGIFPWICEYSWGVPNNVSSISFYRNKYVYIQKCSLSASICNVIPKEVRFVLNVFMRPLWFDSILHVSHCHWRCPRDSSKI